MDISVGITKPGVPNCVHQCMVTPRVGSSKGDSAGRIGVIGSEDIQAETKLENCTSVEVEMRNGEVGVKSVKDGKAGWTPMVRRRRKTSAWSEDGNNSGNLNVGLYLIEGRSLVRNREVNGIPGISVHGSL